MFTKEMHIILYQLIQPQNILRSNKKNMLHGMFIYVYINIDNIYTYISKSLLYFSAFHNTFRLHYAES